MLKQRILTAVPLAVGFVAGIFYLPTVWMSLVLAGVLVLGALEWARLGGLASPLTAAAYAGLVGVSGWLAWHASGDGLLWPAMVGLGWWILLQGWMFLAPPPIGRVARLPWLLAGWLTLAIALCSVLLIFTRPMIGPKLLLFTLCIVWAADIGAYFAGRRWGRHKLAPQTSPGKSWEGAVGGLVAVAALALAAAPIFVLRSTDTPVFIAAALLAGAFSISGDLLESRLKRAAGVKDSGTLLPGHGGVLDRIDSVTAAAPVFLAGLYLLGW